ncbi:MAG: diadenylate cyclase [Clostridiales bacterium]|jgi:diadenylate cyclase|nr:diadenylate cyclase [Clostridiales bacterium]MDY4655176.1 diadenylate cyclase [Eubacteriales bacterium]
MAVGIGNIVSLVFAVMITALIDVFFIKKKSIALLAIYTVSMCVYIGLFVASWFLDGMGLALALANVTAITMAIAAVVVYHNEIKSMFFSLSKLTDKKQNSEKFSNEEIQKGIEEIVKACQTMSKARTGALIVIAPTKINQYVLDSGVEVGALLTASLLESIFNTRAPMHDGAVIVKGNRVLAAGCFLPLSQTQAISKDVGTRHRAAIGITEESDNLSIVVSEENGIISIAKKGILRRYITPERLSDILYETYGVSARMYQQKR